MSPCFPGVNLWILGVEIQMEQKQVADTENWHALAWGQELMRRNVNVLLCAGMDRFLWGSLQGHGIEVVPDAIGLPVEVVEQWRSGKLTVPQMWPRQIHGGCGRGLRRRKGRCGGR